MEALKLLFPIFQWVVSVSPVAVLSVLLILLLRNGLGKRWNPAIFYLLWILFTIRLSCPWVPASFMSLWNVVPAALHKDVIHEKMESMSSFYLDQQTFEWPTMQETNVILSIDNAGVHASTLNVNWIDLAYFGWLIGFLIIAICYLFAFIKWNHSIKHKSVHNQAIELDRWFLECKEQLGTAKDIPLKITSLVTTPAAYGLWKPQILIPKNMIGKLTEDDWKCIFLHELIHIRRKDAFWNGFMLTLVILHWFNPFMWRAYMKMREEQEMSCDLKTLNYVHHVQYGNTLIKTLELNLNMNRLSLIPFISRKKKMIKRRIEMITIKKKRALSFIIIGIMPIFAALIFTNPSITAKTQETAISFISPADGDIALRFGDVKRMSKDEAINSNGIEINNAEGTPVYAAADGVIVQSEYDPHEGNRIQISHNGKYTTIYSHLKERLAEVGQTVEKGQLIGTIGSTGRSLGPHLAFKMLKDDQYVNPEEFIDFTK